MAYTPFIDRLLSQQNRESARRLLGIGSSSGSYPMYFSSTPPASPSAGWRWGDTKTGIEYIYFDDGTSSQWVEWGGYQSTLSNAILADGPILYWKLNEASGTTVLDYSGYGRNGTLVGSATQSLSGLTLTDGTQGAIFAGSVSGSPLDVGCDSSWAIEAIVTRSGTGGTGEERIAGQEYRANSGYYNSVLNLSGGGTPGKPNGGFTTPGLFGVSAPSSTALVNGTRTHLMIVRDAGSGGTGALRLYQNGVEVANNTGFSSTLVGIPSDGESFAVGGANIFATSYAFVGKIEHVAVYDTTISPARVLYHAQIAGLA